MTSCFICTAPTYNPNVPCKSCQNIILSDVHVFASIKGIPVDDVNEIHKKVLLQNVKEAASEQT